jgi:hypothetical protein
VHAIRYVLVFFYYCISPGEFFVYSSPSVHVYIRAFGPQMNTSDIPNMVSEPQIRVRVCSSLSPDLERRTSCNFFAPFVFGWLLRHEACCHWTQLGFCSLVGSIFDGNRRFFSTLSPSPAAASLALSSPPWVLLRLL